MSTQLSIVIPAYDEGERLGGFLDEIVAAVGEDPAVLGASEILVIDDGSTDDTVEVARSRAADLPNLRVISLDHNQGKGAAVRHGLASATGRYRAFLDADGSTPVTELSRLLAATDDRDDVVVIGSIAVAGAHVDRGQVAVRRLAGRGGNWVIRKLAVPGIQDTQRGCKLVSDRWCREVLTSCEVDGWAFDVEMLLRSRRAGYEIVELPISWHHVAGTKVTAASYLQTLRDVVKLRLRMRRAPGT